MHTPDEIKKGLECCLAGPCPGAECPYYEKEPFLCGYSKSKDALAYIKQLERERDALMQDMQRSCFICKNFNGGIEIVKSVCDKCIRWCNWEWRGVKEE